MNEQMNQWIEEIPMNDNEKMIQSQDAALSELRREILAAPAKDKPRWMKKIDQALDVRLQMMKQRDLNRPA